MPLTARHRDGRRIDSTTDEHWAEVHVARYQGLFCPECDHAMHAVDSGQIRVRHFAHNPGRPSGCTLTAAESPEHLHTKRLVAEAVRDLGWTAEIEYPGTGWRADVLAIGPSEQRIAFEPQFSRIHKSTATERAERHARDGIKTVWLDARKLGSLNSLRRARLHYEPGRQQVETARLDSQGLWETRRTPLSRFVQDVCRGELAYDGRQWTTAADRAVLAQRAADAREIEVNRLRRQGEEARQRAAMQWPLRAALAIEDVQRLMDMHRSWASRARQQAAMQWPLRVRDVERKRLATQFAQEQEIRSAAQRQERLELERARAGWRADRDRYCVGLANDTDEEILERCARFADEYAERAGGGTAQGWSAIGNRLHGECLRRDILHT